MTTGDRGLTTVDCSSISEMRASLFLVILALSSPTVVAQDRPTPSPAEGPNIKVLKGLLVPEFVAEMEFMVQALGVNCQFCHVRNNYAAETNDYKITARRMIEMTRLINQQFFPDYTPPEGASKLGKVTCMTCHQGNEKPKSAH